jgi:glutamate-ammonia-ligase adenylyltransferase
MTTEEAVLAACADLDAVAVREFLARMDPDYLSLFGADEIARHVRLATQIDEARPLRVEVVDRRDGHFDVVVVAFDYFSELSIVCGVLASFGLDIESGNVYTFEPAALPPAHGRGRPPNVSPKKIVDLFRARLDGTGAFDAEDGECLQEELIASVLLLRDGRFAEARDRVERRLVEHLARGKARAAGILAPVEVLFDNALDPRWTKIDVRAPDTPAFLFAVTGALAARGVYVHKVRLESQGRDVRDVLFVSDRRGRKIEDTSEQQSLRSAIVLTKRFTHALPWAPDPAKAARHFDQLLGALGDAAPPALLLQEEGLAALARLLGSSDFLWDDFLRIELESLLPVFDEMRTRELRDTGALAHELRTAVQAAPDTEGARHALTRARDREMFFIDMKHLLEPHRGIESFSAALTALAEAVVRVALEAAERVVVQRHGALHATSGAPPAFAVAALGKFGGRELGYASDLELLFVRDGAGRTEGDGLPAEEYFGALAEALPSFIEARAEGRIFHVDLRLRPFGRNGPMVSALAQLRDYYREGGGAEPFERQALIKLRAVAGDVALGRAVEAHRDAFTYSGAPWDQEAAVRLRVRQARELVKPDVFNLKYSPGGLLDVEYAVQYLQIQNGHRHPKSRTPSTLVALAALRDIDVVSATEHDALRAGYLFLRRVIEALRMVHGEAKDLILPALGSDEMTFLSRRLGAPGDDWAQAAAGFHRELVEHTQRVAQFYDDRFGRAALSA